MFLRNLSYVLAVLFGLAGVLQQKNKPLLFVLAVLCIISGLILNWHEHREKEKRRKEEDKRHKELCDLVKARNAARKEAEGVEEEPQVARLDDAAKNMGLSDGEELLLCLEEGTLFDRALKALVQHHYDEAIRMFGESAGLNEMVADSWFYQGNAYYFKGDYENAALAYQRSTELAPKQPFAWSNWGVALGSLGRHGEAAEKFKKALEIAPELAEAWCGWGVALENLARYEEAIEKHQKAVEKKPDFADAWHNWGVALKALGREDEAREKFKRAEELGSKPSEDQDR